MAKHRRAHEAFKKLTRNSESLKRKAGYMVKKLSGVRMYGPLCAKLRSQN